MAKIITPLCENPSFSGPVAKKTAPVTKKMKQISFCMSIFDIKWSKAAGKHKGNMGMLSSLLLPGSEKINRYNRLGRIV